jgi:peptide-methionine (S)-S-oxide reductase
MSTGKRTPATPTARRDRLFVQDVGDEIVIYDQDTRKAHRLNPTAALVWRACDGRTTVADIAEAVRRKLGAAADENLVHVALGRLEAVRLLDGGLGQSPDEVVERRRAFLRKGAAAGAVSLLMPVVATLPRPSLAAALSPVGPQRSAAVIAANTANTYYWSVEPSPHPQIATATLGGGCFWCLEPPYDRVAGVLATTSGYMGGMVKNPTHEQVVSGTTGHVEVVQVGYDPRLISYSRLLQIFWRNIDPTQRNGQFCDLGPQYRTAIFYHDEDQKHAAFASLAELRRTKRFEGEIATEILPAGHFYPAAEDQQEYYKKQSAQYKAYIDRCGREARLRALWG